MVGDDGANFALRQPRWLHCLVYLMIGYKLVEWLIKKKRIGKKKQRQPSKDTRLSPTDNFNSKTVREFRNAARSQKSLQSGVQQRAMMPWSRVWNLVVYCVGGWFLVLFFPFLLIKSVSSFLLWNSQFLFLLWAHRPRKGSWSLPPFCVCWLGAIATLHNHCIC